MWRAVLAATLLCVATQPAVFTEGGSVDGETIFQSEYDYPKQKDIYSEEEIAEVEDKIKQWYAEERQEEERERESNKQMIDILKVLEKQRTDETEFPDEVEIDLQKTKALPKDEIQSPTTAKEAELEKEEAANDIIETQPLVAQKKGQNEFVSFVEPVDAKQTKSVPSLEKRRLATSSDNLNFVPTYSTNLLMLAVGSVLIVGMIGTVVGGGIYLKRRRDTPDDAEYAPYAGTGPGFKKGKGDKGDESLAYKAQLHHYQQAKQKIICGDDAPAGLESEGEDDGVDDENNFSVYECPGLAPTGDIEVCNPNFAAQP